MKALYFRCRNHSPRPRGQTLLLTACFPVTFRVAAVLDSVYSMWAGCCLAIRWCPSQS